MEIGKTCCGLVKNVFAINKDKTVILAITSKPSIIKKIEVNGIFYFENNKILEVTLGEFVFEKFVDVKTIENCKMSYNYNQTDVPRCVKFSFYTIKDDDKNMRGYHFENSNPQDFEELKTSEIKVIND
jgi:hypothetical protein